MQTVLYAGTASIMSHCIPHDTGGSGRAPIFLGSEQAKLPLNWYSAGAHSISATIQNCTFNYVWDQAISGSE